MKEKAIAQQMFAFQSDIKVRRIMNTVFIRKSMAKASKSHHFWSAWMLGGIRRKRSTDCPKPIKKVSYIKQYSQDMSWINSGNTSLFIRSSHPQIFLSVFLSIILERTMTSWIETICSRLYLSTLVSSHHTDQVMYSYWPITADISQLCYFLNFYLLSETIYIMTEYIKVSNNTVVFSKLYLMNH